MKFPSKIDRKVRRIVVDENQQLGPLKNDVLLTVDQKIANKFAEMISGVNSNLQSLRTELTSSMQDSMNTAKDDASVKDKIVKDELQLQFAGEVSDIRSSIQSENDELKQELQSQMLATNNAVHDEMQENSLTLKNTIDQMLQGAIAKLEKDIQDGIDYNYSDATAKDTVLQGILETKINNFFQMAKEDSSMKDNNLKSSIQTQIDAANASTSTSLKSELKDDATAKVAALKAELNTSLPADYTVKINALRTELNTDLKADSQAKVDALRTELNNSTNVKITTAVGGLVSLTGDQTVAGVKTFSSIPVLPSTTPTSNNQAVSKAYVDSIGTRAPTATVRGGVLKQAALTDVIVAPTALNWNALMAALRAAGILSV